MPYEVKLDAGGLAHAMGDSNANISMENFKEGCELPLEVTSWSGCPLVYPWAEDVPRLAWSPSGIIVVHANSVISSCVCVCVRVCVCV